MSLDEESDEELELLRERRRAELQRAMGNEQKRAQLQQQIEQQKQAILRRILTPEARQRLKNLSMVKPEFAEQVELQLIQLAQSSKINIPITDAQLRETLMRVQSRRKDITIRRA